MTTNQWVVRLISASLTKFRGLQNSVCSPFLVFGHIIFHLFQTNASTWFGFRKRGTQGQDLS